MAILLMNLRDVPEDELEAVRAVLDDAGVDYYETKPSLWGVSGGGVWLRDAGDEARARALIQDFQRGRAEQARAARARGERESPWRERPLQSAAALLGVLIMLALSTLPFLFWNR